MELQNTYTYTARSAENPDHLATFTLTDHQMIIDPGTSLQQMEEKLAGLGDADSRGVAAARLLKPAALWAIQRIAQPFALDDVAVNSSGDDLHVRAWTRAGGLRLAPVMMAWNNVDNNKAAEQFAAEVEARKAETERAAVLPGPLDYWLAWLAGGLALVVGIVALPRLLRQSR
jgi:hypothetical protein